ncbi:hypothetical protein SCE1572_21255 [Sorangium cellulosum So0157-2]|uniref:Uncharacterized protein n=2 Tax=Sorangium cellulosum TaxID=56 RepID=S4XWB3_SORCE|nr:hypothetical protein SCE1572_21255 [Sorangium cellulosum So0157-2]
MEAGSFERVLGPQRGAAYRRFLEWSVGGGFMLAVVEMRRPAQREALVAATDAAVPSLCIARLASVGARPVRTLLDEVCPSPAEVSVLMLTHLEESENAASVCSELNVHRDEFARTFALPWVLVVHPAAALALQRDAPDFCDFAGLWLPEESGQDAEPLLEQAIRSPAASPGSTIRLSPNDTTTPKDLLSLAHEAAALGHVDKAEDLLAQYDMKHPDARTHDIRRIHMDGLLLRIRGRLDEALTRLDAAMDICKKTDHPRMKGVLLSEIAHIRATQGDYLEARRLELEALEILEREGDLRDVAASLHQLSAIELHLGKNEQARSLAHRSLNLSEELGDPLGRSISLYHLSFLEARAGNHAEARELVRASLTISDEIGDRNGRFASLRQLATLAVHESNYSDARELLREALELAEEMGSPIYRLMALQGLAAIACFENHYENARKLWRESLELSEALGAKDSFSASLVALGMLEASQGQMERGLALVRQGVEVLEKLDAATLPEAKELLRRLESLSAADASP